MHTEHEHVSIFARTALPRALSSFGCRFGDHEHEVRRRGDLRSLVDASRALAVELQGFVSIAAPLLRDGRDTAAIARHAESIGVALAQWGRIVHAASATFDECSGQQRT